ncbi:MAG: hypothetical protein ACOZB0_01435 [Pseudomonadota bacterium]
MKFHELPLGARFQYQGQDWVKCSPVMARTAAGEQRLIPRWTVLSPRDEAPQADPARRTIPLDAACAQAALAIFRDESAALLARVAEAPDTDYRADLEAAYRRALDQLK